MTETILQSYLNEQHIKTDVQDNIDSLTKAVNEVKRHLTKRKEKSEIIPFTLVALDPKVSDTDPVVHLVEDIIIKKWPAFKNSVAATKDKSTTYVRAVILESLSQLTHMDTATAVLVWLTARDVIGYLQLGLEENVIREFLQELANRTEENGRAMWRINCNPQIKEFNGGEITISGIKGAQISEDTLTKNLLNALVYSGWSQSAGGGTNPYNPGHNNWQWPQYVAEHSAKGICEVINSAFSQQTKSFSSISISFKNSLDAYFAQFQPFFENLSNSFADSISVNNKRSELLWWKQSLYSRSLNTSYRKLNLLNMTVCMALDLAELVGAICPESVDYLLRETLKDVYGEQVEEERLLTEWLMDSHSIQGDIQSVMKEHAAGGYERKPLLCAWANVLQSGETTEFFKETGIEKNAKLTVSDLAVWLFHGLQAQKLATIK